MPRPAKPPRLFRHKQRGWVILDRGRMHGTGAGDDLGAAEKALGDYIAQKWAEPARAHTPDRLTVGRALAYYADGHAPTVADPARIGYAIDALARFWAGLPVSAVTAATCRRYGLERGVSAGTVRRELGALAAALNWNVRQGYLTQAPAVTLPDRPAPKDRWFTRDEVAKLLRGCRTPNRRHLARFILIGIYTGSRKDTILRARWTPSLTDPWFDLDRGVFHRAGAQERRTKKRRGSAPIPRQLAAHLRRWKRLYAHPVEYRGGQVGSVKRVWRETLLDAGIEYATPHALRHTAATWMMQRGVPAWEAAGYLSMSEDVLRRVYGHHSPDYMSGAREAMERK